MSERHFLSLGDAIIERLRERLPEGVDVEPSPDIDAAAEVSGSRPTIRVIYDGYQTGTGPMIEIQQTWLVVLVLRNTAQVGTGSAAFDEGGRLATQVIRALHRWRPAGHMLLSLTGSRFTPGYQGGRLFLPLAFTSTFKETANADQAD